MTNRAVVFVTMCVGLFLVQLDVTIVNVALPRIGADLHAGRTGLQWVVDGYAVPFAALLLAGGTLGDRFGRRLVVLAGLVVFGLGSAACGLAPSAAALVAARALQGAGAAILLPGTLAIITHAYRERTEQARAIGAWAAVSGLALPAGPLLGGLLVQSAGWRWVFLVNLPVVALALAVAVRFVPESQDPAGRPLDVPGAVLAALTLGALTFAVIQDAPAAVIAVLALVAGFVAVERVQRGPMLPLGLFRSRTFSVANTVAGSMNLAALGLIFALTLYLQGVQGRGPLVAGASLVPMFALLIGLAPLAGRLVARTGPRPVMAAGLLLAAAGMALVTRLEAASPYIALLPALVLIGAGLGLLTPAVVSAAMAAVPGGRAGLASGVNNTARQAGGAIGVATFGALAGSPAAPQRFLEGLHVDGVVGAALYLAAAVASLLLIRRERETA